VSIIVPEVRFAIRTTDKDKLAPLCLSETANLALDITLPEQFSRSLETVKETIFTSRENEKPVPREGNALYSVLYLICPAFLNTLRHSSSLLLLSSSCYTLLAMARLLRPLL